MTRSLSVAPTIQPNSTAPAAPAAPAITRRGLLAAGAATAATTTTPFLPASAGASRPNIIVINCDDLATSVYEACEPLRRTLETRGRRFLNFVANVPSCGPSRACLLTGRYPQNHGVIANDAPDGGWSVFEQRGNERDNIAVRLKRAGYRTCLVGKYMNDYEVDAIEHVPPGWDDWHAWAGRGKYDRYLLNDNGVVSFYDVRDGKENYETDLFGLKAREFLLANQGRGPFFLYLAPHAPHMPALPSRLYRKADAPATGPRTPAVNEADVSDKPAFVRNTPLLSPAKLRRSDRRFREQVRSMYSVADLVDSLLHTLEDTGQLANTYLLFTSDNGFFYGEHRIPSGKGSLYEEGIQVPFVAIGPGIEPGSTGTVISTVDIAPTLLDLAGQAASDLDGRSFTASLASRRNVGRGLPALVQYGVRPYDAGPASRIAEDPSPRGGALFGLRGVDWTYIYLVTTDEHELYDLRRDPLQLNNIYSSMSETARARLRDSLTAMTTCRGATCRSIAASIPATLGLWFEMV